MEEFEKDIKEKVVIGINTLMEDCLKKFPNPGPFATEGEKEQAHFKQDVLFIAQGLMGENLGMKYAIEKLQEDFKGMLADHREALVACKRAHKAISEGNQVEAILQLNKVTAAFQGSVDRLAPMDGHNG